MHRDSEVAAYCSIGGKEEPLCAEHAKIRCAVCQKVVCSDHSVESEGGRVCEIHAGFWRSFIRGLSS